MLELLFELIVSVGVCVVVAFFLFLGSAEDDGDPDAHEYPYDDATAFRTDAARPQARALRGDTTAVLGSRASDRCGLLPHLWARLRRIVHLSESQWDSLTRSYDNAWTALVGPNSMLGRDREDEASGAIAEILRRRTQQKLSRRHSTVDFLPEDAAMSSADATAGSPPGAVGVGGRMASHRSPPTEAPGHRERLTQATAPPVVTNHVVEGAQWLNVVGLWLAVLLLGGGTTQPHVWADRVQHLATKCVGRIDKHLRATSDTKRRNAAYRTVVAPRQLRVRRQPPQRTRRRAAPLLTLSHLSLGRGALTAYHTPSHVHHVAANSTGNSMNSATGNTTSGITPSQVPSASGVGAVSTLHENATSIGATGTTSSVHRSALGGAMGGPVSVGGVAQSWRLSVPQETSHSSYPASVGEGDLPLDASIVNAMGAAVDGAMHMSAHATGPVIGVVLPRVSGAIASCECFHAATATTAVNREAETVSAFSGSDNNTDSTLRRRRGGEAGELSTEVYPLGAIGPRRGSLSGPAVSSRDHGTAWRDARFLTFPASTGATAPLVRALPTRTFTIPIAYEDPHVHLRLGSSLPISCLLPAPFNLIIPAEVLRIDSNIDIRQIVFHGRLHVAWRGPIVEIAFAESPQFTAMMCESDPYLPASSAAATMERFSLASSTLAPRTVPAAPTHDAVGTSGGAASAAGVSPTVGPISAAARYSPSVTQLGVGTHHHRHTGLHDRNKKMHEVSLNALRNMLGYMTYPKVLRGQPTSTLSREDDKSASALPPPVPPSAKGRTPVNAVQDLSFLLESDDEEEPPGLMTWGLATASLPLFTA